MQPPSWLLFCLLCCTPYRRVSLMWIRYGYAPCFCFSFLFSIPFSFCSCFWLFFCSFFCGVLPDSPRCASLCSAKPTPYCYAPTDLFRATERTMLQRAKCNNNWNLQQFLMIGEWDMSVWHTQHSLSSYVDLFRSVRKSKRGKIYERSWRGGG